ncbi:FHA domain-containing protein [Geodermatophilus chilensis]|jgi:transcriptional regulator with XRE-family HTH domain|uniref:FHA domain-containing protein n=1 Tax=Geodermatophilus chilensis TaxID=2035835 RepID=UPI000C269E26|nr:FHA domain-containing protein [Geodermatophilus chilensis]
MGTGQTFGDLLRAARLHARLTQEELAQRATLSPRSISDLERGINRTARKETARLLADALSLRDPQRERFIAVARGVAPEAETEAFRRWAAEGTGTLEAHVEVWTPSGVRVVPLVKSRVTIGRDAGNDVALIDDRAASRVHAVLERVGQAWCLQDAGSRNGTYVCGERLLQMRALRHGDDLAIGSSTLVFREADPTEATQTEAASPVPELTGPDPDARP